jgi:integrase
MSRPRVPEIEYRKVRIRIYRSEDRFSAQFPKSTGGRERIERATERLALQAAKESIDEMRDPERRAGKIDHDTAMQLLAKHKVPLTVAVQDYARRLLSIQNPLTVTACAANFLAKQERDTGHRNVLDLHQRIGRFETPFGKKLMHEISEVEINNYLDGIEGTKRTRRNHRDSLVTFFRYAQRFGSLSKHEKTVAEQSVRPTAETPKREILSPSDGALMLSTARAMKSSSLAALVLLGFCGSRHEEICPKDPNDDRLAWNNVLWNSKRLYTPTSVSKMAEDRYGPLLPKTIEWLRPFKKANGPIFPGKRLDLEIAKIARKSGVNCPHNGFRHSFITYRILVSGSPATVADEAGNSLATIEKHYRKKGVEPKSARKWFKIEPAKSR